MVADENSSDDDLAKAFRNVGVVTKNDSTPFIAMFASHVGVAITIALAVAASSIAVVAPLASTSSRTLRYCGFVDF
jgi:hypothetical protein